MSDLIEVAGGPRKELVGTTERVFEELNLYEKAAVMKKAKENRKKALIDNAKLAGLPAEQIFVEIENFQDKQWDNDKWIGLANDAEIGQFAILAASLEKTYPNEGEALVKQIKWTPGKTLDVVAHVAGLVITATPQDDGEGGADGPPADRYAPMMA